VFTQKMDIKKEMSKESLKQDEQIEG
jgi:hypothetical protein